MSNPLIQRSQSVNRPGAARGPEVMPTSKALATPPTLPKVRRKAAKSLTAKALIAAASVAITLSGWALLVAQEAPLDQGTEAVAYTQTVADNRVANVTNPLDSLRKVTLPMLVEQSANSPAPTNNLRVVTAPPVSNATALNSTANGTALNSTVQQPRLRIRTRSSR